MKSRRFMLAVLIATLTAMAFIPASVGMADDDDDVERYRADLYYVSYSGGGPIWLPNVKVEEHYDDDELVDAFFKLRKKEYNLFSPFPGYYLVYNSEWYDD